MKGKVIISAVSLILVVGVIIGVVVDIHKNGKDPEVQTQQRNLRIMCQNAQDQKLCHETLSSVHGADAADPKAYIAAAVKAATDNVMNAFNMSERLTTEYGKENGAKMALDDCKDLMQFALDSLDLSNNCLSDNNIQAVHDQTADMRNWLSAVISYRQACMEGFDDANDGEKKIKEQFHVQSLDSVQKITAVALDIVTGLSDILQQFNLKFDIKPLSRRLLNSEVTVDDQGYPSWISASDRKLLAKMQRKNWRANIRPNAVVANDGSGQFKTIQAALASYPKGNKGRYFIYVKAGVYDEYITVPKDAVNILMYGDGPARTIVTGRKNFAAGTKTMQTATFANTAIGFIGKAMTFENTAGPDGHQAVAFRNVGDMSALVGCHIVGYQDSLYVQSNRQYYRNCLVSDGSDTMNLNTGIVIQDCNIIPEAALFPERFTIRSYLGRPWKYLAKTVVMESTIGDFIHPDGWTIWQGEQNHNTCYYAEYANTGPGANVARRVKWKGYHGVISRAEANKFTAGIWLQAGPKSAAEWLNGLHVPHYLGFKA
ncbi:pectinesterase inhibitor domain protein [Medicago truncatula]|uniref:Pectinesterase n=1 Tax=Medicago truncatula TaxID=3880 RepID=G7KUK2_MEDTR|nr:pectinesterase inhibitor domain protein [Medicago truncatula]